MFSCRKIQRSKSDSSVEASPGAAREGRERRGVARQASARSQVSWEDWQRREDWQRDWLLACQLSIRLPSRGVPEDDLPPGVSSPG